MILLAVFATSFVCGCLFVDAQLSHLVFDVKLLQKSFKASVVNYQAMG